MSEPSGVRTRSQRQREPGEEQADPEMATSAAEQFEGERQPSAGGNDESRQSQSQAPGAEAPTTTSEEDKMQTLMRLLMNMNQKMDRQAEALDQKLDLKLDQQTQVQARQTQKLDLKLDQQAQALDQHTQKLDQQAKALDMKLDQQFSRLDQEISQLSQQTGREVSRLDEEIGALNQKTEDLNQKTEDLSQKTEALCREVEALLRPSAAGQRHQLSVGVEPFVPSPQGRTEPAAQDRQLSLPRHHQKIPRFDGKAPWEAYLAQFHIMAKANGWGDSEKAYYLSTSIEGPALSMLANLSAEDRTDFPKLIAALENRFGAKHQQQQSRVLQNTMKRKKNEPLQELVENIERRVRLAYPEATGEVQEALTMHHLTTAVDERMQAELLRGSQGGCRTH